MIISKAISSPVAAATSGSSGQDEESRGAPLLAQLEDPEVFIEITNRCNFHCFFCRGREISRRPGFMTRALFEHVLVQVPALTTRPLCLHVAGEPTLHPEFFELARCANQLGIKLLLATNATGLKTRFLELEMDVLIYLSTSKDDFSQRASIPFEGYLEKIERYVAAWLMSRSPQNISFAAYFTGRDRREPAQASKKMAFIRELANRLGLRGEDPLPEGGLGMNLCYRREDGRSVRIRDLDLAVGGVFPNPENAPSPGHSHPDGRYYGFCDSAWRRLAVLVDGSMAYCCRDVTGGTAFTKPDQILHSPLATLWRDDPAIKRIRRDLLGYRVRNPVCQACLDAFPLRHYRCSR